MSDKPLIFVSSTSDLAHERQALASELRPTYDLYLFEEDRARGMSPEQRCREQIERSDVFVGILGAQYGSAFPGDENQRSIVEWEFDTALAHREDLEIMPFVKHGADTSGDPRQRSFLTRLGDFKRGVWFQAFDSADDLVREVRNSLQSWLIEFWSHMQAAQAKASLGLHRKLLPAVAVLVVLVLVLALTPLGSLLSNNSLIAVGIIVGIVALLALVLLLAETGGLRSWLENPKATQQREPDGSS